MGGLERGPPQRRHMVTLDQAIEKINERLNTAIACRAEDIQVETVSTGSFAVDVATGIRGFPRGYITEVFGEEGGGKSTLALTSCINAVMHNHGLAVYMDAENKTYPRRPIELGIDGDKLVILEPKTKTDTVKRMLKAIETLASVKDGVMVMFRPYTGTLALDVMKALVESGTADIIVIDSVHALTTAAEKDSDAEDKHMAMLARLMSQSIKSSISDIGLSDTAVIFINQTRTTGFGSRYTWQDTPGGKALKFYSALRIRLRQLKNIGDGVIVSAEVKKNCLSAPDRKAEFDILFDSGIDQVKDLFEAAKDLDIIQAAGGYYKFLDEPLSGFDEDGKMIRTSGYEKALSKFRERTEWHGPVRNAILNPPRVDQETGEIIEESK